MGSSDDWGENPHQLEPPSLPGDEYPDEFQADYAALLYLGLYPDWSVRINHASYNIPGSSDVQRLNKAVAVFTDIIKNKNDTQKYRFKDHLGHNPYRRATSAYDGIDFSSFRFKSPTELFILIHQVDASKVRPTKIILDSRRLISFSSRQLAKNAHGFNLPAERNYSYFRAEPVLQPALGDLFYEARMIRVQNWARGEYGSEIIEPDVPYSMNIHFIVLGVNNVVIPIVIDPDTGNGAGHEP